MDEAYDPLSHLSTALSLLPRTLAGVGYSLPPGLSDVDQIKAFFSHMHGVLNKVQKSRKENLEKHPCPNPNTTEKEGDGAATNPFEGQQQAFLEPMMRQQHSTRSYHSKPSPNPVTVDRDETGRSFEGKLQDVKSEPSEPMQLEQPHTNSYERESPHSDRLHIDSCETRNGSQGKNCDNVFMELQPKLSISSLENKPSSKANRIAAEKDETGKDSSQGNNGDTNSESIDAATIKPRMSIIGNAIESRCLIPESMNAERDKTENISFDGQNQYSFESVEFTEMAEQASIAIHVNSRSPNPDSMVLEKEKPGKITFEGESNLNFRSVASMLESRPSIHSQVIDKTEIERDISERSGSHPKQMVENKRICRRPGLGLDYNISPFTLIQKDEKAKQVVPVDFTVLDHISDPDGFTKKVYELEASVAEIKKMGGEAKIIGQRVFKMMEDDQPRRRRPGLRVQMPRPEFVLLPMRPLPAKVQCACACYNQTPTESTNSPEMTKAEMLSGSQNEAPSSISNATQEVPEMNSYASSSSQRLLSVLESWSEDEEKAVAMVYDCLNLKQRVIPEMPKFSRLDVVKSPCGQLPSVERVRDVRGEDSLGAFEELKRRFFMKSSAAYCSDDDTNSLAGIGSIRSLSASPGCQFSFENEDIETPYHTGPSGSPIVEIEELSSQEKVPEMTSESREGIISDEDIVDDGIPDEPEVGSPWDNSPVNIEVAASPMPLENSPVNAEAVVRKEASSKKGKKRRLEHADSSLDVDSKILTPTSDSNAEAVAETSLVEPPRERDDQAAPPNKKTRKQQKGKNNIHIVEGGLQEEGGVRRSTRIRSRPLRGWMGERFLYARVGNDFPIAVGVKECSPATVGMRVKVKSFVSDEHADLVARLAK